MNNITENGRTPSPGPPPKLDNRDSSDDNPMTLQSLVNIVLHFLSTSSNETLIGVFLLSAAATYFILGKIGLLLIGIFLGVILHVSWEGPQDEAQRKRMLGLVAPRDSLSWPKQRSIGADEGNEGNEDTSTRVTEQISKVDWDYSAFQPAVASALRSLTDSAIDNYVK